MNGYGIHPYVNSQSLTYNLSPEISLTLGGEHLWNHGLDVEPEFVQAELVCKTAEIGWAVGDVAIATYENNNDRGAQGFYNATQCGFKVSATYLEIMNRTSGQSGVATIANWRVRYKIFSVKSGDIPDITRVGLVPLKKKVVVSGDADVQFNLEQYFQEYEDFEIEFKNVRSASAITAPNFRHSGDGTIFDNGASDYRCTGTYTGTGVSPALQGSLYAYINVNISSTGIGTNQIATGIIRIYGAEDSNFYTMFDSMCQVINSAGTHYNLTSYQYRSAQEQTKAIQAIAYTGNLQEGTFILYGKRKVA
jgi:hypothetical protein